MLSEIHNYSRFANQHSNILCLIHSSAAEWQYIGTKHSTRYLIRQLIQEDKTDLWKEIDLWLRQFYKVKH